MIYKVLFAFASVTALDYFYGRYTVTLAERKRLAASLWAIPLYATGGAATIAYVADPILLIPAAAGAFVGTWLSLHR